MYELFLGKEKVAGYIYAADGEERAFRYGKGYIDALVFFDLDPGPANLGLEIAFVGIILLDFQQIVVQLGILIRPFMAEKPEPPPGLRIYGTPSDPWTRYFIAVELDSPYIKLLVFLYLEGEGYPALCFLVAEVTSTL